MDTQQNTPWQYKPSSPATSNGLLPNDQPQAPSSAAAPQVVTWQAAEFIEHPHNAGWYSGFFLGSVVITAIVYLTTKEYFAAVTTAILAILAGILLGRKPRLVNYEAADSGLKVDGKLYEYNNFKSFSIIQEGAMNSISLLPLKRFMPPLSAYFADKDQETIVAVIGEYLPYEERKADAIDRLSHRLRF